MKSSTFGMLAASAVASLIGSTAHAESGKPAGGDAKACYRTHCGTSVKGHDGTCGGTKVDAVTDQKACETAGGAWATEAEAAAKYQKKM